MGAGWLAAEGASNALVGIPSSPVVWYLNRGLLGFFRNGRFIDVDFEIAQWLPLLLGLSLLSMAWWGFLFGRRLMLALASNLNLTYAFFLICTGCDFWPAGGTLVASRRWGELLIAAVLLSASIVSALASHLAYRHAIRDEGSWPISISPISSSWSAPQSCSTSR